MSCWRNDKLQGLYRPVKRPSTIDYCLQSADAVTEYITLTCTSQLRESEPEAEFEYEGLLASVKQLDDTRWVYVFLTKHGFCLGLHSMSFVHGVHRYEAVCYDHWCHDIDDSKLGYTFFTYGVAVVCTRQSVLDDSLRSLS